MNNQYSHTSILTTLMPRGIAGSVQYVGNTIYANLTQDTIMKACLCRGDNTGYYGLSLTILHKHFGQVDSVVVNFPAYTTKNGYSVRKMLSTCMNPSDVVQWDEPLTMEEVANIHSQVQVYINLFSTTPGVDVSVL